MQLVSNERNITTRIRDRGHVEISRLPSPRSKEEALYEENSARNSARSGARRNLIARRGKNVPYVSATLIGKVTRESRAFHAPPYLRTWHVFVCVCTCVRARRISHVGLRVRTRREYHFDRLIISIVDDSNARAACVTDVLWRSRVSTSILNFGRGEGKRSGGGGIKSEKK